MNNVERIKDKLGIVDVVGSYMKIAKAGKNFKGRCPFHNEKTPSFFISPERESFYCFGCGRGGDIFTFVEEFEGLDFLGSMKVLADKAGVEIVYGKEDSFKKKSRDEQYVILEEAVSFYEKKLSENRDALLYLKKRGLKDETIKLFRLGFAPAGWRNLADELVARGYAKDELKKVGLIGESKGKHYDLFRERIIFPIMDSAGRSVALAGRVFGGNDSEAKYINSPETALYNKSKILYGFDKAKFGIRKNNFGILVEGYMDAIMAHQALYRNTIAVSGTSLTEEHVEILRRLTARIVFAFDSDSAGLRASARGAKIALRKGLDLKVSRLPEGKDPADIIKENPDDWAKSIKHSEHIIDYYLGVLKKKIPDERKFALAVREEVLPYAAMIENKIDQSHFIKKIAGELGSTFEAVLEEIEKIDLGVTETMTAEEAGEKEKLKNRRDEITERMTGLLLWKKERGDEDFFSFYGEEIKKTTGMDIIALLNEKTSTDRERLISMAEFSFEDSSDIRKEMSELILNFEEEFLREKRGILLKEISGVANNKLLADIDEISKRIEEIKAKRGL